MCNGDNCPLKETCYRYLATPNPYRQSFFETPPYNEQDKDCEYFIDDTKIAKLSIHQTNTITN